MSELADLLELLHGAGSRWKTVRLAMTRWGNSELAGDAMRRYAAQCATGGQSRGTVVTGRGGSGPPTWQTATRAWVDRTGDRSRVETSGDHGDRLTICTGYLWWAYSPESGSISNETELEVGGGGGGDFDWMLEPSSLLPALDFTPMGTTEVAGRQALDVLAVPRPPDPHGGFAAHFAHGADDIVLAVDVERGVVLRAEARLGGELFARFEITDLAFDEDLSDDLFRFVSPDGSPVRSPRSAFSQPEPMSVEEAATRASFTVLVPTLLPEGWILVASYVGPSERPPRKDAVLIRVLEDRHKGPRMQIHQASEPFQDMLEWDVVERGGRRIAIFTSNAPTGAHEAKMEASGTHVRASGNLDQDAFLDIVASLAPAPTDLPPMLDL